MENPAMIVRSLLEARCLDRHILDRLTHSCNGAHAKTKTVGFLPVRVYQSMHGIGWHHGRDARPRLHPDPI